MPKPTSNHRVPLEENPESLNHSFLETAPTNLVPNGRIYPRSIAATPHSKVKTRTSSREGHRTHQIEAFERSGDKQDGEEVDRGRAAGEAGQGRAIVWTGAWRSLMGGPLTEMPLRRAGISARALSGCPSYATASLPARVPGGVAFGFGQIPNISPNSTIKKKILHYIKMPAHTWSTKYR
jgi:hypothetical protein